MLQWANISIFFYFFYYFLDDTIRNKGIVTENNTTYIDKRKSLEIYTYDSEDENDTNNTEIKEFNSKLESFKNNQPIEKDNETYNKSKDNHYFYHAKNKKKKILVITNLKINCYTCLNTWKLLTWIQVIHLIRLKMILLLKLRVLLVQKNQILQKMMELYWDDEYNTYFDKNDKTAYESQFKKKVHQKKKWNKHLMK